MKCLETRRRNGMKWRRYRTEDGRIVTTYELPTEVLRGAAEPSRLQERLDAYARADARRARRQQVISLLAQGWKPLAIASEVGLKVRVIQELRAQLRSTTTTPSTTKGKPCP